MRRRRQSLLGPRKAVPTGTHKLVPSSLRSQQPCYPNNRGLVATTTWYRSRGKLGDIVQVHPHQSVIKADLGPPANPEDECQSPLTSRPRRVPRRLYLRPSVSKSAAAADPRHVSDKHVPHCGQFIENKTCGGECPTQCTSSGIFVILNPGPSCSCGFQQFILPLIRANTMLRPGTSVNQTASQADRSVRSIPARATVLA